MLRDRLRKSCGRSSSSRYESHVDSTEIVVMLQLFYCVCFPAEFIFAPRATRRTKEHKLVHREVSFFEYPKEFLSHCATGSNNCRSHLLLFLLIRISEAFSHLYVIISAFETGAKIGKQQCGSRSTTALSDESVWSVCMQQRLYELSDVPKDKGPEALFSSEPFCSKSGI